MTKDEIIKSFDSYLSKSGNKYYSDFYIGITDNIKEGFLKKHNVPRKGHWYLYTLTDSIDDAVKIRQYYLDRGMRGSLDTRLPTTNNNIFVYCYKVTPKTIE